MSITLPPSHDFHTLSNQESCFFELLKNFSTEHAAGIKEAYACAKNAHGNQMRDDGTPYILHPLRATLSLITECGITALDILSAMLLHDVIEDTPVTFETIERQFGAHVAHLVQNVTRPRPSIENENVIRTEKEKKFMTLMDEDEATRLIKSADVLDNVRSWPNIPCGSKAQKKIRRWHEEIERYALPLAQKTHPVLFEELSKAFTFSKEHSDLCADAFHYS